MRPFRFVHVADVHLDTPFHSRDASLRRTLREAAREAFRRAVDLALQAKVHAFLIAGDLFDHDRISFGTERFLMEQLARLAQGGITAYYACGNHDPGGVQGPTARMAWPQGVVVFSSPGAASCPVAGPDGEPVGAVTGAGHGSAFEGTNLVAGFPAAAAGLPGGGLPHVGLVHAWVQDVAGRDDHDRYAPCLVSDLEDAGRRAGIHYWALGHIHQRQEVCRHPRAFYPGNLQGRHFRETGPKGALLVDLYPDGTSQVEFVPLAPVRWETVRPAGLEKAETLPQLQETIEAACLHIQAAAQHRGDWLWRVELAGPCPLADRLADEANLRELEEGLAHRLGALHVEVQDLGTTRPVDPSLYRDGIHPLAVALQLLEQAQTDDALLDRLTPDDLAGTGSWAEGGGGGRRAYLRELLAGLDLEAAARLADPSRGPA